MMEQNFHKTTVIVATWLSLWACTSTPKSKTESAWKGLDNAGESRCKAWPMGEHDLEVQSIHSFSGQDRSHGAIAKVKTRSLGSEFVNVPRVDQELDYEQAKSLPLPPKSMVLAAWNMAGLGPLFVTAVQTGSRAFLEARSASDNRLIAKSNFVLEGDITDAAASVDGDVIWLSLHMGDYETQYARFKIANSKGQFDKVGRATNGRGATLVADNASHETFVVENEASDENISLKLTPVHPKELTFKTPVPLTVPAKGGVESWSVTSGVGGIYVAAVTGDSMVGQSRLDLGFISTKDAVVQLGWHNAVELPDVHVSEPVWAQDDNAPVLTLMKWLDGEATMGVYRLDKANFVADKDRGVFARGAVVTSAFKVNKRTLETVVRLKKYDTWTYQMCQVVF